jgi:hypothetical protein
LVVEGVEERAEVGSGKFFGRVHQALESTVALATEEGQVVAQNVGGDAFDRVGRTLGRLGPIVWREAG